MIESHGQGYALTAARFTISGTDGSQHPVYTVSHLASGVQCYVPKSRRGRFGPYSAPRTVRRRGSGLGRWCSPRPDQLVDGDEPAEEVIDCSRYQEVYRHISFGCGLEKTCVQRLAQPYRGRHSWFLVAGSP